MATDEEKHLIQHPMPSAAEMRAEIKRKIAAGEPLGASHVARLVDGVTSSGVEYARYAPSNAPRWLLCPRSLTKNGNPK